jgi:hypothetical protein
VAQLRLVRRQAAQFVTKDKRLHELRRQRDLLRGPEFRTSVEARRDVLSAIVPLLNFNEFYYSNAVPIADVLGRPGFSPNFYDHAYAQMDSIVSQAINELERGLTPAPSATPKPQPITAKEKDERSHPIMVAVIGALTLVIVALIPILSSRCQSERPVSPIINRTGKLHRIARNNHCEGDERSWVYITADYSIKIGLVGVSLSENRVDIRVEQTRDGRPTQLPEIRTGKDLTVPLGVRNLQIWISETDDCWVDYAISEMSK